MTDHPLTEDRAQALWDKREDDSGFRWNDLFHDQPTALAAMRAAFDAGREHEREHADPHHDARPWQDCTREDIRAGDLVETQCGTTTTRISVAHRQDEDGDWWAGDGFPLTWGDHWLLRRIPAPTPPAEEVALPTTDGAVIIPAEGREFIETFAGRVDKLVHLSGKWYGGSFPLRPEQIAPDAWREDDQ